MQEMKCIKCGREAVGHWATIARNDEIRDNITRMRREWEEEERIYQALDEEEERIWGKDSDEDEESNS